MQDSGSVWPSEEQRTEGMEQWRIQDQEIYDAGARYVDTECVSHGLGDWDGVADEGLATGYWFTCEAGWISDSEDTTTDVEPFNWVVTDGVVVAVNSGS